MKHIVKIATLLVATASVWIGLLKTYVIPSAYALMMPVYLIVSLGCYGLLMVGVGLMQFPTCPQESLLLQQLKVLCGLWCCALLFKDIVEAKSFLKQKGVDVGST